MGTRVDFYVGRGKKAEWIGSAAYDGYPEGIVLSTPTGGSNPFPKGEHLFDSKTEYEFRDRVQQYFSNREDVSLPTDGWPWPWEDSQTTDYSYAFDGSEVFASCFGHEWFDPHEQRPDGNHDTVKVEFPNMKEKQKVTLGKRSGLLILE